MKILIYGAGVLGSFYAARLQEAHHDVSLLARGQRLADLEKNGVVLREAKTGKETTTHTRLVAQLAPDDAYDLVVVIVRKDQLTSVLPALAKNTRTPNVLFMLNNAAGPSEMIAALGRERVVLGFPIAGGWREGRTVNYLVLPNWAQKVQPLVFGELDGNVSPRLERIMGAFQDAGFHTAAVPNMDAWLKTHASFDVPIVAASHAVSDVQQLAHTRDASVLTLRAIRENFSVLRALGVPVTPRALRLLEWLPEPLLTSLFGHFFGTEFFKAGIGQHTNDSPGELLQLAGELRELSRLAAVPTPAADRLQTYLDPAVPPIPGGSKQIRTDSQGVEAFAAVFATAVGVAVLLKVAWKR